MKRKKGDLLISLTVLVLILSAMCLLGNVQTEEDVPIISKSGQRHRRLERMAEFLARRHTHQYIGYEGFHGQQLYAYARIQLTLRGWRVVNTKSTTRMM